MYLSVKEYAKIIDKSDKSIYKMIKGGLIDSKKDGKKIQILVDENMVFKIEETCKKVEELEIKILNLEKKSIAKKKTVILKKKPLKKIVLKKLKKPLKKRTIKK